MARPVPIAGALVTAALLLVAGGCGFKSEPTGTIALAPVTVNDAAGQPVSVAEVPTRIVSLDPGMTELLFTVGAGGSVVGRSGGPQMPAAAGKVPVASASRPKALLRLHPSLVIADASDAATLGKLKDVAVYVTADSGVTAALADQLNVSLLAGRGPQGRAVVQKVQRQIARTTASVASAQRAKVYLDQGAFVPPGPMASSLISAGGGDALTVTSAAELRRAAPTVYLSEALYGTPPAEVKSAPGTKHLPAAVSGHVYRIPTWWVTTDGPSMAQAVAKLAAVIHPGQ